MLRNIGEKMIKTKIDKCPKNKKIKVKGKTCLKCNYHNTKKIKSPMGEISNVFCTFEMTETEKNYI